MKAALALRHYPSALLAVLVAALLVALAASSSPLVTTAAASEALKNKLADLTPLATGLQISGVASTYSQSTAALLRGGEARDRAVRELASRLPHVGRPVLTLESAPIYVSGRAGDTPVRLMARTNFLAHIHVLTQVSGDGVWISNITAHEGGFRAGGNVAINVVARRPDLGAVGHAARLELRVKGIYRALAQSPSTPYWINLYQDIYPQNLDASPPPSYLFVSRDEAYRLANVVGEGALATMAELPIDPKGMTLAKARALDRRFGAIRRALPTSSLGQKLGCESAFLLRACKVYSSLSAAVILADRNASAVSPAVTLLSDVGGAIALGVAAAAGAFLVRRRRSEAALRYARGAHPLGFAARTAAESLLPTLAGGAAGLALAYGLTSVFAPSGSLDPATLWSALAHAAAAVAIGLLLLVLAATFAFVHLYDTGVRGRVRWLRFVPWELPLLGVALYLLVEIRSGGGLSRGVSHHPTLTVFVFPLLLVAAAAGLGARVARRLLARGSRRLTVPAAFLALRRLAAARGLLVVMAVVSAVALGAFVYAETLSNSLRHTTVEKAYMATGSDAQVTTEASVVLPHAFPYPITKLELGNQDATLDGPDGPQADTMVVDPATLAGTLHWQGDWGANPESLLRELRSSPSWPLPVIVTSDVPATTDGIVLQGTRIPVRVLGRVRAFPLMDAGIPLVITSFQALGQASARTHLYDPLGVPWTYVLAKGPPDRALRTLASSPALGAYYPASIETFLRNQDVVLASRTFRFMRTIAVAAAVLVFVALLLYLQARQRSLAIASALLRRMGFGRARETVSLALELTAILAFAGIVGGGVALAAAAPVVRHVDPLPNDAPAPIFVAPTSELIVAAGALVVLAVLASLLTEWLASRTDVSEALRVA